MNTQTRTDPASALTSDAAIHLLLHKFAQGDTSLLTHVAEAIDFRIDHYDDEADVSWQTAQTLPELIALLGQLTQDVFPKGTKALGIDTYSLGNGWHFTRFHQQFFYGVRQREVTSQTYITSHEIDGKVDFFRETVTNIVEL